MGRKEKVILIFEKDGETLRHKWIIKKGIRGARDSKRVRNLQKKWGDPKEIIGDGPVATLLRKEYAKYYQDIQGYKGVSPKDLLLAGAEVTGVPVKKIQQASKKLRRILRH